MENFRILPKRNLNSFLAKLKQHGDIIAPVKTDTLRFQKIKKASEICFTGIPKFPAKNLLFPQNQDLFTFEHNKINSLNLPTEKLVLFGLRKCDLNSIHVMDKFLADKHPDYKNRRKNILLIGLNCEKPVDRFCFCSSMELSEYYDLFFYETEEGFVIRAGTDKGLNLIKDLEEIRFNAKDPACFVNLSTKDIKYHYDDKEWDKIANECISCGMCTNLCPTCMCFDIKEEVNLDLKCGKRCLEWDSCQFRDFTKVAGKYVFRKNRVDRFKHRIYHKLEYFKEDFDIYMCTGCGRCIRHCPLTIYWTGAINHMVAEKKCTNQRW